MQLYRMQSERARAGSFCDAVADLRGALADMYWAMLDAVSNAFHVVRRFPLNGTTGELRQNLNLLDVIWADASETLADDASIVHSARTSFAVGGFVIMCSQTWRLSLRSGEFSFMTEANPYQLMVSVAGGEPKAEYVFEIIRMVCRVMRGGGSE